MIVSVKLITVNEIKRPYRHDTNIFVQKAPMGLRI